MKFKEKITKFTKKFKLDSHHAIERFGLFFGFLSLIGVLVLVASGASSMVAGRDKLESKELWTPKFTTSKTQLKGTVDGVYTNSLKNKALVMMHFDERAKISYNASDYEAFLLGSDEKLNSQKLETDGVTGSFHVFGSTGYVGVLLEAKQPFAQQVLNLTVRANAELSFAKQRDSGAKTEDVVGDKSFDQFDQWRVFMNPGATGAKQLNTLDATTFDAAKAFYEVALKPKEEKVRGDLDTQLVQMRTNLAQIKAYTEDLATTKVDGLFLRPPSVPAIIAGDQVTGKTIAENKGQDATLALNAEVTVPSGFNFDWRSGNVYDGYLDVLVPAGQSYVEYLQNKVAESGSGTNKVNDIQWILSNGKSLTTDYRASDVTMRPLVTVMNNLSQAYQDYYTNKVKYQSNQLLDLLTLDVDLRGVRSNSTVNSSDDFLVTYR